MKILPSFFAKNALKNLIILTLLFSLSGLIQPIFAETLYQIELYVFTQDDPGAIAQEIWTTYPIPLEKKQNPQTVKILPNYYMHDNGSQLLYRNLETNFHKTRRVADALDRAGVFRILYQATWRQPIEDSESSRLIWIDSNDLQPNHEFPPYPEYQSQSNYEVNVSELVGILQFTKERFLHAKIEFYFTTPITNDTIFRPQQYGLKREVPNTFPPITETATNIPTDSISAQHLLSDKLINDTNQTIENITVRLKQARKIKTNTLYYFDHPLFGTLLQLSKVKQSQKQSAKPVSATSVNNT